MEAVTEKYLEMAILPFRLTPNSSSFLMSSTLEYVEINYFDIHPYLQDLPAIVDVDQVPGDVSSRTVGIEGVDKLWVFVLRPGGMC